MPARRRVFLPVAVLLGVALAPVGWAAGSSSTGSACERTGGVLARTDGWLSVRPPSDLTGLAGYSVDPSDSQLLFAYDATHLDRSADGGCSWHPAFALPASIDLGQGERTQRIADVQAGPDAVWVVTSTARLAGVGQSAVYRSPDGTGSYSLFTAGLPAGADVRSLVTGADHTYALVHTALAGDAVYAAGAHTWSKLADVPLARLAGIAASPTGRSLYVWADRRYVYSADSGRSFITPRSLPGPIATIDAGATTADVYVGGRLIVVSGPRTVRSLAAPSGVRSAAHVPARPAVRAVATATGNFGYDDRHHRWLDITPVGAVAGHLRMAGATLPPTLFGATGTTILKLPLTFPAAFVPTAGAMRHVPPVPLHAAGAALAGRPALHGAPARLTLRAGTHRRVPYRFVVPPHPGPLDVYFLVDTTDSMTPAIDGLRHGINRIVDALGALHIDVEVGLGDFRDFQDSNQGRLPIGLLPHRHHLYVRDHPVAPVGPALGRALAGLNSAGGGVDPREADTIAVTQAVTGSGYPGWISPGQQAGFRPAATKVIVLVTDSGMMQRPPYPSMPEAIDAVRAYGVKVVGIVPETADTTTADHDLGELVHGSGVSAPPGGVDCDGDGHVDVRAGAPLVCNVGTDGSGASALADPVVKLLEQVVSPGQLSVRLSAPRTGVATLTGRRAVTANLRSTSRLSFAVDFECPRARPASRTPVRVEGAIATTIVAQTTTVLRCVPVAGPATPIAAAAVAVPAAAALPPPGAVPPPPPPPAPPPVTGNVNPNVNPGTGAAAEEQQQSQLATATAAADDHEPGPEPVVLGATALTAAAAGAFALRHRPALSPARVRTARVRGDR